MLVFFMAILYILRPNGIFMAIWYILWSLVYFSRFGMLYREKSGNPEVYTISIWVTGQGLIQKIEISFARGFCEYMNFMYFKMLVLVLLRSLQYWPILYTVAIY
jgi:hypothetical protein